MVTSVVSGCGQVIERSSELRDRAWHVHCSIAWHQGGDRVVEWWSESGGVVEQWLHWVVDGALVPVSLWNVCVVFSYNA